MKKIIVALAVVLFVGSCNTAPDGFTINGELRGELENGTKVFLKATDSLRRGMIELDTATVENGKFTFVGTADGPQIHYLFIDGIRSNAPIILENGEISFKAHKDSLAFADIKGTVQNQLFMDYLSETRTFANISKTFNDDVRSANARKDTAALEALRAEYLELQERAKTFEMDFVKNNPNALISGFVLEKLLAGQTMPISEADSLYNAFTAEIQNSQPGKRIAKQIKAASITAIGAKAPEFSGPTPDGGELALSAIKGKVTLIDFWAAWCKPCRAENPNIVAVYQKYKDKGLQVVGVSLDRNKADWEKAIADDGLEWNHISNLQYFQDPIAKSYNINAIPAAFLLDENGIIVAKNLRGKELEEKVAELLQ